MASIFPPIPPAPARELLLFDFTTQIGVTGSITSAVWTCVVNPYSPVIDPDPASRLVGSPTYDQYTTTVLVGDMLDRVVYELQAIAEIDDGRVLIRSSELLCAAEPAAQPPLVIDGAVQFDYPHWVAGFPEFAALDPDQAQAYWEEAGMIFRNDANSMIADPVQRREVLELLTAHLAALFAPAPIGRGGSSGPGAMMGVITSKSVNGVSVSSSGLLPGFTGFRAWLGQTQYGVKFLMLTAGFRQFHYVPGPYPRFPPSYWPYPRWPSRWLP